MKEIVNELYKLNKNIQTAYKKYPILFLLLDLLVFSVTFIIAKTISQGMHPLFICSASILLMLSFFGFYFVEQKIKTIGHDKENLYKHLVSIFYLNLFFVLSVSIFLFLFFSSSSSNSSNNNIIFLFIIIIFVYIIRIGMQYAIFNDWWLDGFKKIVIENLNEIISPDIKKAKYSSQYITGLSENLSKNLSKYLSENLSENLSKNVLYFVSDILLANTPNLDLALKYKDEGFNRKLSYNFYDKMIIELDNEIKIEIIEIEIYEVYKYLRSSSLPYTIKNFEGLCVSSKLPINYNSNYPILIYYKTLFEKNYNSINLLKTKESNYYQIIEEVINYKNLNYDLINIKDDIYFLYHLDDKETISKIQDILIKYSINYFINNNLKKSFIVYDKNIIYLFINKNDIEFGFKKLLQKIPGLLEIKNPQDIEKILIDFKNEFQKVFNLIL